MKGVRKTSGLGRSGLAGFEADLAVRQIAERACLRLAAAAEDERPLVDGIGISVPIDDRHIVSLDAQRPVLANLDDGHQLIFCIAARNSLFDPVLRSLSSSSSIASTAESGFSTLRSTQMRFRSSRTSSSSSLRVPLFWMSIAGN